MIKTKENHGSPSEVRNIGIRAASGKYISFIDDDDYFEPDYFARLYDLAVTSSADFVSCGVKRVLADGRTTIFSSNDFSIPGGIRALGEASKFSFNLATWGSIALRELLIENDIFYTSGVNEDVFFNFRLLYHCSHYVATKDILYYFVQNDSTSLSRGKYSESYSHIEGFTTILRRVGDFLSEIKKHEPIPEEIERSIYLFWMRLSVMQLGDTARKMTRERFDEILWRHLKEEFGIHAVYIRGFIDMAAEFREDLGKPLAELPFSHRII